MELNLKSVNNIDNFIPLKNVVKLVGVGGACIGSRIH